MIYPNTISTLNTNGFYFAIQKYSEIDYFLQEVTLPDLAISSAMQATSVHDIKNPGDTLEFGSLELTFLVDEHMHNYLAIHDWMVGLGFPVSNAQYSALIADEKNIVGYGEASKTVSDCMLTLLDANNKPFKTFKFADAWPSRLSGITFSATNSDYIAPTATLTLVYSYYTVT